jgi:hypothetical protein
MPNITKNIVEEVLIEITHGVKTLLDIYKLGRTDLVDSIEWVYKDQAFVLIANDYMKWVDRGRRPGVRKVPIEPLIKWMKKKGIRPRGKQTYNSLAFAIQNAIFKSGIKAKKIFDPIIEYSIDAIGEWIVAEFTPIIAEEIVFEIEEFNKN